MDAGYVLIFTENQERYRAMACAALTFVQAPMGSSVRNEIMEAPPRDARRQVAPANENASRWAGAHGMIVSHI